MYQHLLPAPQLSLQFANPFSNTHLLCHFLPPEKGQYRDVGICTSDPHFSKNKRLNPPFLSKANPHPQAFRLFRPFLSRMKGKYMFSIDTDKWLSTADLNDTSCTVVLNRIYWPSSTPYVKMQSHVPLEHNQQIIIILCSLLTGEWRSFWGSHRLSQRLLLRE